MSDFKLTPAREKELEKIAKDLPDADFKKRYGNRWMEIKMATAMNILKKKHGFKTEEKMKFKQFREKYRSRFKASEVAKAVEIALSMGGNMTGAYQKIEKIKKGLGDDPVVKDALKTANEETVKEAKMEISLSKKKRELPRDFDGEYMDLEWNGKNFVMRIQGGEQNSLEQEISPAELGVGKPRNEKDLKKAAELIAKEMG
jgi:hypothetical protein